MSMNNYVHSSQVGFSLTAYISIKTGDKLTKNDLNFSYCYWPQNAPDCISGATLFTNLEARALLGTPLPDTGYFHFGAGYSKISGEHWFM